MIVYMKKIQFLPLICALLLTFLGGFGDAYTYIIRDGTFAAMQTGNLIKFFVFLADGAFKLNLLLPIVFFIAGAFLATLISRMKCGQTVALFSMFIITLSASFCPQEEAWNIVCVCALSIAGAMQFVVFHHYLNYRYASTMATNNMKLLSESIAERNLSKFLFYFSIIVTFSIGVVAGAFISKLIGIYAVAAVSILFVVVFILRFFIKEEDKKEA